MHRPAARATIGIVSFSDVPTVSVDEVPETNAAAVLLDVREDDEWALGHAPGAVHIPLADVPARLEEIDIDAEVYVVCRQGGRSLGAVQYLNRIGYDAIQVNGGMVAWQKSGLPLVSDGDEPAKIY
nr:rhodanese-like domain-containing protein [Rhodococcus sp. BL-253-APC-6A1W]